jgi:replicative DNA helicase
VNEPEDVFKLIRDCIRRYGVKWVMFDNVQKLCDDTLKNQGHRTVQLSQISKKFATLAKDYHIKLIRILQPRQIEEGQMVQSRHTDGSSQIAKDCDVLITMWRSQIGTQKKSEWEKENNLSVSDVSFEPKTKLAVVLSRYSSGGHCTVYFDGARSQVREYDESLKTPMSAQKFNNLIPTEGTEPKEGETNI